MKVIHFAGVVLAWAVSTTGLFTSSTSKSVEFRLRQIGHGPLRPYLGTLVAFPALSAAQGQQRAEGVDDPMRAR